MRRRTITCSGLAIFRERKRGEVFGHEGASGYPHLVLQGVTPVTSRIFDFQVRHESGAH
jgi:hypothetical protein